jgi:hypothetical protein
MTRTKQSLTGRSQFEDFLYAPIGKEGEEVQLSVLSALSRENVDPWAEAEILAKLPKEIAIQRLAGFIAATDRPVPTRDARAVAAQLIAHLHGRVDAVNVWREALIGVQMTPTSRALRYAMMIVIMLSVQWMITSCEPLMKLFNPPAAASTPASPQKAPPAADASR